MEQLPDNFMELFKEVYHTLDSDKDVTTSSCRLLEPINYRCKDCKAKLKGHNEFVCLFEPRYPPYAEFLKTFDQEAFEKQHPELLI